MNRIQPYKISVGTATDYEDYVAEIHFPGKAGILISQERGPGEFDISIHSFDSEAPSNFDYCRNINAWKIPFQDFMSALDEAISELQRLKKDC